MIVHPSLIEKVSLDAREHNADVAADIKRSFAYVGPVTVVAHEACADAPVTNEIRLVCRMSRPYWTDDGEGAQMWQAMRSWLEAKAYKVGSTIANFNKSRAEAGRQTVSYDRVVLDMKPYTLDVACPEADKLPDLAGIAQRMRDLLGAGAIAADVAGIEVPAAASLAEQLERFRAEAQEGAGAGKVTEGGCAGERTAAGAAALGKMPACGAETVCKASDQGEEAGCAGEGAAVVAAALDETPACGAEMMRGGTAATAALGRVSTCGAEAVRDGATCVAGAGDKVSACENVVVRESAACAADAPGDSAALAGSPDTDGRPAADAMGDPHDLAGADATAGPEASGADAGVAPTASAADGVAAPAPARLPHLCDGATELDYTLWDVRLADGTTRTLDSVAGTWL